MRITSAFVILALAAAGASAQPAPGSAVLVNTYTTSSQSASVVATDARAGFVVVWNSYTQDGDRGGLFARRFDRVVSGCGDANYCPASPVTRQEMAVFVLRTKEPDFTPPGCSTPMFADVPTSSPFCPWIEELARRGVVSGCGGGNYCPTDSVTREQMAVFLSGGLGLTLYGL